jgi:acyl-CoA reductase-like NAD-dependent aldehyde dehydrogenase
MQGSYKNSGQRCTTLKRMLVQKRVVAAFVDLVVEKARVWSFGDPFDTANRMGTVIYVAAAQIFDARVNETIANGAGCGSAIDATARCSRRPWSMASIP